MKIFLLTSIFYSLIMQNAFSLVCPEKENIPYCPDSGTTLLDETFPTQAFLISNSPNRNTDESKKTTEDFVKKIITSFDYKNIPQILITTDEDDFNQIKDAIEKNLLEKKLPKDQIQKILQQFSQVKSKEWTWQQDWFESFVDLKTGNPRLRQVEGYKHAKIIDAQSMNMLTKETKDCDIQKSRPLKSFAGLRHIFDKGRSFRDGEGGGNIEGAPGGYCLSGDNQSKKFTAQFCGSEDNIIQLQTSWLIVGHVDEIFKIIPTNFNDGRPKECEFSIMTASPKKALELMKDFNIKKQPFLTRTLGAIDKNASNVNYEICQYVKNIIWQKGLESFPESKFKARGVFLKLLLQSPNLNATELLASDIADIQKTCAENLDKITNEEMAQVFMNDNRFLELNNAIDESINNDKLLIKSKILNRLPQCAKYYNELDVPNLFYGDRVIVDTKTQKISLSKPGSVKSFLPNPTNSVTMNKTITFPSTENAGFNKYLKNEMEKRKMKADFINTWDYAHVGSGNLHCVSHTISHCRPRK